MAEGHARRGGRPARPVKPRQELGGGRRRVTVALAAPDGAVGATRGLGSWLTGAAPARARGDVTIAVVSDGRMKALNRTYRGKDYATDVLSFPVEARQTADGKRQTVERRGRGSPSTIADHRWPTGERFLGDIVIAAGVAERQADEAGHSLQTELRLLALHGLLHLLGYDHESDAGKMRRVEARLRHQAGLREGLTERVRGRPVADTRLSSGSRLPSRRSRPPSRSRR